MVSILYIIPFLFQDVYRAGPGVRYRLRANTVSPGRLWFHLLCMLHDFDLGSLSFPVEFSSFLLNFPKLCPFFPSPLCFVYRRIFFFKSASSEQMLHCKNSSENNSPWRSGFEDSQDERHFWAVQMTLCSLCVSQGTKSCLFCDKKEAK